MKGKLLCKLVFLLLILFPVYAGAQDSGNTKHGSIFNGPPPSAETSAAVPAVPKGVEIKAKTGANTADPYSSFEFLLSIAVLSFGLIVVFFEVFLAIKRRLDPDHVMKVIILTLVITGAIVLITAGYSNNQITGVTGILGSIAGYMLGKTETKSQNPTTDQNTSANEKA